MSLDFDESAASMVPSFWLCSEDWLDKRYRPLREPFFTVNLSDCSDSRQIPKIHKRSRSWSHPSSLRSPYSSRACLMSDEHSVLHSKDAQPTTTKEDFASDAPNVREQRLPGETPTFPPQAPVNAPQDLPLPAELKSLTGQPQTNVTPETRLQSEAPFQQDENATLNVQHGYQSTGDCQTLLDKLEATGMPHEMAQSILGGDATHTPLLSGHQYNCQADSSTYQLEEIGETFEEILSINQSGKPMKDIGQPMKDTCRDSISRECPDIPEGCTLMIRNLPPCVVTTGQLASAIKYIGLGANLQCLYMPQTFRAHWQQNNSYAFVNFDTQEAAAKLKSAWHHRDGFGDDNYQQKSKWKKGGMSLDISMARIQGLRENLMHWRSSKTSRIKNANFRPMLFNQAKSL